MARLTTYSKVTFVIENFMPTEEKHDFMENFDILTDLHKEEL